MEVEEIGEANRKLLDIGPGRIEEDVKRTDGALKTKYTTIVEKKTDVLNEERGREGEIHHKDNHYDATPGLNERSMKTEMIDKWQWGESRGRGESLREAEISEGYCKTYCEPYDALPPFYAMDPDGDLVWNNVAKKTNNTMGKWGKCQIRQL